LNTCTTSCAQRLHARRTESSTPGAHRTITLTMYALIASRWSAGSTFQRSFTHFSSVLRACARTIVTAGHRRLQLASRERREHSPRVYGTAHQDHGQRRATHKELALLVLSLLEDVVDTCPCLGMFLLAERELPISNASERAAAPSAGFQQPPWTSCNRSATQV
jgi:hypothetical protein